jgi:ParB-like chromosome segregation protein Spo0J
MGSQVSIFDAIDTAAANPVMKAIQTRLEAVSADGIDAMVNEINAMRELIHRFSPFKDEPVDFVKWVPSKAVVANEYNPNSVAPPEMKLLEHSINQDGYTQPIVTWPHDNVIEVIDGFHRHRVGKESPDVSKRIKGYLPTVIIKSDRSDKNDRMAATIRHNRARGKHAVNSMSDIVVELKRRNWTDERICRELGMDKDEVLRLCQITGLAELFSDQQFSRSWDVEGAVSEADFTELTDNIDEYGDETSEFRTVNTSDEGRIFHTYDKWECHKAGFYSTSFEGMTKQQCLEAYRDFLADIPRFDAALKGVITEWKHSCEHYLTNKAMNRIAWLGQAAMCYATGVPAEFRGGFSMLAQEQQHAADAKALEYLNKWMEANGREALTMEEAYSGERQSQIY